MRLTYRDSTVPHTNKKGELWEAYSDYPYNEVINKLAAYEDAEEQGLLGRLPCKVGDALFVTDEGTVLPAVRMVESVTWCNGKILIQAVNNRTGIDYYCSAEDFGKTVFLSRKEAEAVLKGGQDGV